MTGQAASLKGGRGSEDKGFGGNVAVLGRGEVEKDFKRIQG